MHSQQERLHDSQTFMRAYMLPFKQGRPACDELLSNAELKPMEGWCGGDPMTLEQEAFLDPLCIHRLRHDIKLNPDKNGRYGISAKSNALFDFIRSQAPKVRAALAQPETQLNQAVRVPLPKNRGTVRVVNQVHTVYGEPLNKDEKSLDEDEESDYGEQKVAPGVAHRLAKQAQRVSRIGARTGQAELQYMDMMEGVTPTNPSEPGDQLLPPPPPDAVDGVVQEEEEEENVVVQIGHKNRRRRQKNDGSGDKHRKTVSHVAIRELQRKLLALGCNKNSVGTAVSLRYTQPWVSTQLLFSTLRLFTTGSNNPLNDRSMVKYVSVPLMHRSFSQGIHKPGRHYGARERISQNIVASLRLPPGKEICLGLLLKQLEGGEEKARIPKNFKSIVLAHPIRNATLLVYRRNVICVGTSSMENLLETFDYFWPALENCMNTPENLAAESEYIRNGTIDIRDARKALNYQVTFHADGTINTVTRVDDEAAILAKTALGLKKQQRRRQTEKMARTRV